MIDPQEPDFASWPGSPARPRFAYVASDVAAAPAVSIVTPYFESGPLLHETAHSVLGQSLQQWEWIIVNDGSGDDEVVSVLERYRAMDPRVRVVDHERNRGLSAARNTGVRAACAPFVVLLDSDDLLEPTALEKWLWCLVSYPEFGFVKGFTVGFGAERYLWSRGFHDGAAFLDANLVEATCMIRRSVYEAAGGHDETIRDGCEDWDFWLRCADLGQWGATVPEYLTWYRRRTDHGDRWESLRGANALDAVRVGLRARHPRLSQGTFPRVEPGPRVDTTLPDVAPCPNHLRKPSRRLLMVLPSLEVGGADEFALDLLGDSIAQGWEVSVATTIASENPWLARFAAATPDVFALPSFLRRADYPRFLRYLIHSRGTDVVLLSHTELAYHLTPYLRACFPALTIVDLCHLEEQGGGHPRRSLLYQESLDSTLVCSDHLRQWMVDRGAAPERVRVCYAGVDVATWRPDPDRRRAVRAELGVDEGTPVLLYPARICAQKRPAVLVRAIERLVARGSPALALVAGDGPDMPALRALVARTGLRDRIRLCGAVPHERVRHLLQAADVLVLPSAHEGIALALYEAMACGLCVVAADVGGQRELVTPACGILVSPSGDDERDADAYAEELGALLRDPARRARMGAAARERVAATFDARRRAQALSALLEDALRLHIEAPRAASPLATASAWALQAIEGIEPYEPPGAPPGVLPAGPRAAHMPAYAIDPFAADWRTFAYFGLRRLLLPWYRLAGGARWAAGVKERLKGSLLGGAEPRRSPIDGPRCRETVR